MRFQILTTLKFGLRSSTL